MGSVPPSTGAAAPGLPHPARGQPCHVREHLAGQRQARAPPPATRTFVTAKGSLLSPQCTTRGCRTSWRRSAMPGAR